MLKKLEINNVKQKKLMDYCKTKKFNLCQQHLI